MEEIFEKEITEDKFNAVIAIVSTNPAPSPTGLTFNMIKKLLNDAKEMIWKWKWLGQKPKIDSGIPTAGDLQPLCLLDCLRKLWERLFLRRMTSVWDTHNILNETQPCKSGRGCSAALIHFLGDGY